MKEDRIQEIIFGRLSTIKISIHNIIYKTRIGISTIIKIKCKNTGENLLKIKGDLKIRNTK